jgi:hypothetical protein
MVDVPHGKEFGDITDGMIFIKTNDDDVNVALPPC